VTTRLVLFGAPGAGKGTQAALLKEQFGALHVSTGDLFRKAMNERSTLGAQVRSYIDVGYLVPDEIVMNLIRQELVDVIKGNGFIFDGFPRTVPQAEGFEKILRELNQSLTAVISLEVEQALLISRISGRRVCPKCEALYHVDTLLDKEVCPLDNSSLEQRKDDAENAVKTRLKTFALQTLPLKEYYKGKNLLLQIDGYGSPSVIFARILSALQPVLN
jgi:adenylate kinase